MYVHKTLDFAEDSPLMESPFRSKVFYCYCTMKIMPYFLV